MEVKFRVANKVKEEDLIEARMYILKNDILGLRILGFSFIILQVYLSLRRFIYFNQLYSYSAYPFVYREICIGIGIICVGIFTWKCPALMLKEKKDTIDKYKNHNYIENIVYFYETCIKTESELGNNNINYSHIKKVYETPEKFIFLSKNKQYVLVSKDSFIVGDSNKFRDFLKEILAPKVIKDID
ncbi:MAG: YcxB family protein [Clostridium sp.]|uniref:YcxB family protein n=1 Tax=Clostridium sp. TaxID=1506 RepID=UPI00302E0DA9